MKKWVSLAVIAAALVSCTEASGPVLEPNIAAPRTAVMQSGIPGAYVITLADRNANADEVAASLRSEHGGLLAHVYKHSLVGFAIRNLSQDAADRLARDPRVASVTPDQMAYAGTTQSPATWGLDRTDQQNLPLDNSYTYTPDGTGVHVYSIDTGILYSHVDFGGRAFFGGDFVSSDGNNDGLDCNGHGTHTSGTMGGATYGIAKNVTLHSVRVLSCGGSAPFSDVVAGVDWVTANHIDPAVANMSLGGSVFQPLDDAVTASIAAGVTYTISAGNSNADACNASPARTPNALTVGATTITDSFASFSNGGICVDISGPGENITSDWIGSNTATLTISGTSMSAPHVAGVAALYLDVNPTHTPAQVGAALVANATPNKITSINANTPNLLLYSGFLNGGGSGSIASFTYTCSGFSCTFDGTGSTGATAWSWTFGDGGIGSGSVVTHLYASARAKRTVTLNTTPSGPSSSTSKTLTCKTTPAPGKCT